MSPIRTEQQPPLVLVKLLLSLYLPGFTASNEKAAAAQTRTASSAADLWRAVTGESKANKPARRLAADDVVVFGEMVFCLSVSHGSQMFSPFSRFFDLSTVARRSEIPH